MRPSSTVPTTADHPTPTSSYWSASIREYRRPRTHLFPLEDYRAAVATGGIVQSYCGIFETVSRGDPDGVEEVSAATSEDCTACVDLWHDRTWVRL